MKIFNELEYANKLIKSGFTKTISMGELIILAKYFRYIGIDSNNLENELISFCKKHVPEFIYILHYNKIDIAIRNSEKYLLRIPVNIPITENELKTIKELKNYRYEKILFTMLVLGKYFKLTNTTSKSKSTRYYISAYDNVIFRLAHTSQKKGENIMHYLYKQGLIDNIKRTNSYYLLFTSNEDESEIVLYITDINNIIKFYPPHCDVCGKDLVKKGNRQYKCDDCKNELEKIRWIQSKRKQRHKMSRIRTM